MTILDRLEQIHEQFKDLETQMADPAVSVNQKRFQELAKEHAQLRRIMRHVDAYRTLVQQIKEDKEILAEKNDLELYNIAAQELPVYEQKLQDLEKIIRPLLVPRDIRDEKNVIMEIRAGTGGDEAALFAGDLYRMYTRYIESQHWRIEILSSAPTELGGFKEIIFSVHGEDVFFNLKYERGGHRVQRIPTTETGGRIHTSAATVAVLPEADEIDFHIDPKDLRIDVYRASGAGGQHVNKTESAVRITHIPTNTVVQCQDEKSQHKNKHQAMKVLRARLQDKLEQEERDKRSQERKSQIGSGDRNERIRTYNFPQGRMTDHRINLTLYKLDRIMEGELQELIDALKDAAFEESLRDPA